MGVTSTLLIKKGATLTMAITLSILDRFAKILSMLQRKFPTNPILGCAPHLNYVAALPWKT